MKKSKQVAEQLVALIKDNIYNSHRVDTDGCLNFLLNFKQKLSQVPSIEFKMLVQTVLNLAV